MTKERAFHKHDLRRVFGNNGPLLRQSMVLASQKPGVRTGYPWSLAAIVLLFLPGSAALLRGQGTANLPTRWQVSYTPVYTENFEGSHPGIQLFSPSNPPGQQGSAVITTDPSLVIAGAASARIGWFGKLVTVPSVVPLVGNNTYIVEFQYHILNIGTAFDILHLDLQPVGTTDTQLQVNFAHMQLTAPTTGTFSAGGFLPGSATYVLTIASQQQTDIVIDNLTVYQQNAVATTAVPPFWAGLETLPFPRLGKYQLGSYAGYYAEAPVGSPYTLQYIASTMAFFDVQFGVPVSTQTELPEEVRTARQLNPNAVIVPYRIAEEQDTNPPDFGTIKNSNVTLDYQFFQSVPAEWYIRDTKGNVIAEQDFPSLALMNVSSYCPVVNGDTYISSVVKWLNTKVLPSGEWDGLYLDNLYGDINTHIPNYQNPALIDVDLEGNGTRSTPAEVSEMARSGATSILQQLRQTNGDQQVILGNGGNQGPQGLDPYVNGYLFECVNYLWNSPGTANFSPAAWRAVFDAYRQFQASTRRPRTNALEGCGPNYFFGSTTGQYPLPTIGDIVSHRFTMGTALLGNGFYSFDLHGGTSRPLWYDEYSVNSTGKAVQDVTQKGYLGQALTSATELAGPSTLVLQDGFEGTTLSSSWTPGAGPGTSVAISQDPGQVISGSGSLVLNNPDHTQEGGVSVSTNPKVVQFTAGNSYLLTFDWRILDTVDTTLGAAVSTNPSQPLDVYSAPGRVTGDHGTAHVPFTIPSSGQWSVSIYVVNGGEVAIDNVTITQGNVGPWRRDFENGFVLVNPYNQPHDFSAADLAGSLNRTGIHRIKGTQAPDVNNGRPVTGDLTLAPFDAIILLADHMSAPAPSVLRPTITPGGVVSASAFGEFSNISPGSWVEIYGSNLSATTRGWTGADFNGGAAPTSLDGVSVMIGGRPAYIEYVSPGLINALAASDAAIGPMQVVVSGPAGDSAPYLITVQPTEPGILAPPSFQISGTQYVTALFSDGQTYVLPVGAIPGVSSRPAKPGETITLYGVGFGPVTPNLLAGTTVSASNSLSNSLQILFGTTPATLSYSGLAPGSTGLYQFDVTVPNVPDNLATSLTFNLGGVAGIQTLSVPVQH